MATFEIIDGVEYLVKNGKIADHLINTENKKSTKDDSGYFIYDGGKYGYDEFTVIDKDDLSEISDYVQDCINDCDEIIDNAEDTSISDLIDDIKGIYNKLELIHVSLYTSVPSGAI